MKMKRSLNILNLINSILYLVSINNIIKFDPCRANDTNMQEKQQLDCDYSNSTSCGNGIVASEETQVFSFMLAICLGLVLLICIVYALHQRRLQGKSLCIRARIYAHDSSDGKELKFQRRYGCQTRKNSEGFEIEFSQPDGIDISTTSNKPIGVRGLNFYFEVMIAKKTRYSQCVCIGVCASSSYSYSQLPGWKKCSIGYKSDDGKLYTGSSLGRDYSSPCDVGDTVGCGFDGRKLFFTMNGHQLLEAASTSPDNPGQFLKDTTFMCVGADGAVKMKVKVRPPFLYPGASALLMPVGQLSPCSQMNLFKSTMATRDPSTRRWHDEPEANEKETRGQNEEANHSDSSHDLPMASPVSPERPTDVPYVPPRPLPAVRTPRSSANEQVFVVQAQNPPESQSPQVLYSTTGQTYATPGGEAR